MAALDLINLVSYGSKSWKLNDARKFLLVGRTTCRKEKLRLGVFLPPTSWNEPSPPDNVERIFTSPLDVCLTQVAALDLINLVGKGNIS